MKFPKILFVSFLFVLFALAGCDKNDNSVDNPVSSDINSTDESSNTDALPALSKYGGFGNDQAVYTLSNSSAGNEVIVFSRSGDGSLSNSGAYSTGGTGTGSGLGSQGSLILEGNLLFAVNAGSNEISVLSTKGSGLTLVDKKPSGGEEPVSLTVHGNLLYVLNAGGTGNITGFRIHFGGSISQIPNSTMPLSSESAGPAQIEFSPDGEVLIVTEKATNSIDTYVVGYFGVAHGPITQASAGDTPYGFVFDKRGHLIVSDAYGGNALAGAMSSYFISRRGIRLITGPVYDSQTAPCWVAITNNGRFAYTTNTGTRNISGYTVDRFGRLKLFDGGGNTASTGAGSKPIDMAVSNDSQYLYALSGGTNTISIFRIDNGHGGLTPVGTVSGFSDGTVGLAAN